MVSSINYEENKEGNKWVLEDVKMMSVDFVPQWKEIDKDGKDTKRFKASIGQKYINFNDLPLKLQRQLKKFVISVLKDNE